MNQAGWSENKCRYGISVLYNLGVALGPIEFGACLTKLFFFNEYFDYSQGWGAPPLRKIKSRNFFMMDSDRALCKKLRGKNRSKKFLSIPEILIFL